MTQEREAFSDLPPLPEPRTLSRGDEDGAIQLGYTADQMHAYARASLAQPASVPAGWKLVPVEPTDAMGIAGGIAWESSAAMDIIGPLSDAWAAMLAAAPQAPQPAQAVPDAVQAVIRAMRSDPDYAWSWHCNIAMSFVDAGGDHYTANQGAARFMRMFAGVDPAYSLPAAPQPEAQPCSLQELIRLASICPELNIVNYGLDDVEKLNDWAVEVAQEIDRLAAPSAQASQCTCPSGDGSLRWPCQVHPPSAQAEHTTAMGHVHKDAAQRMDAFYQAFNGKQAEQGGK